MCQAQFLVQGTQQRIRQTKIPTFMELTFQWGKTINEYFKQVACQTVISVKGKNRAGGRQGDYVWIWERVIILHRVMVIKGRIFHTEGTAQAKALGQYCAWSARRASSRPMTLEQSKGQEGHEVIQILGIQFLQGLTGLLSACSSLIFLSFIE